MIDDPLSEALSSLKPSAPRKTSNSYDEIIDRHSQRVGLDGNLVRAIIGQESSGRPRAVSPKNARGLMQLIPATAARFNVRDVFDPEENIRGGTDYLKFLNDEFGGDVDLMLAGYNAGEGAVKKFGNKIPPYRETQQYVPAVKARYQKLTGQSPEQDPLTSAVKTLRTSDPLSEAVSEIKPIETPQEQPKGRFAAMADATANPVRNAPRRAPVAQVEDSGLGPQFPRGTTTGIATSRNGQLVGRQRTPQIGRADVMRAEEAPRPGTGTYDFDPRLVKGEQPSDPMAYAKAQELVGRVEPIREVGGIRAGATAMGPRDRGVIERVKDAILPHTPGLASLDTPMGPKTDFLRGAASLGMADLRREISPEERLVDPDAGRGPIVPGLGVELDPYSVGQFAPAVVPYIAAGKAAGAIPALAANTRNARIARTALTFGGVEAGREAIRTAQTGEDLDPQEIAISTAIGGSIGRIAGVNPSLKRELIAAVTPQVVVDVARGTDPQTATFNAVTNLGFGLHGYKKAPRGLQNAAKVASGQLREGANETPATTLEAATPQSVSARGYRGAPTRAEDVAPTAPQSETAIPPNAAAISQPTRRIPTEGVTHAQTKTQPNVETQLEGAKPADATEVRPSGVRPVAGVSEMGGSAPTAAPPPRHVDLQPRRARNTASGTRGQFKKEPSKAEAEARRQQVNQVQGDGVAQAAAAAKGEMGRLRDAEDAAWERLEAGRDTKDEPRLRKEFAEARTAADIAAAKDYFASGGKYLSREERVRILDKNTPIEEFTLNNNAIKFSELKDSELLREVAPPPAEGGQKAPSLPTVEAKAAPLEAKGQTDPLARLREQAQNVPRENLETEFPSKVREPRQPKSPIVGGAETRISIPDSKEPLSARYEVREASDVYSSHDPVRFSPNPEYRYTNDRRYDQEKQYQAQVIDRAKNLDPAQLVNNSPTADLGPPIIDADGNALGGNSRTMMIKRAYRSADPKARDAYRKAVIDQAAVYGVDPAQIAGMKQPVLVRVLSDASIEKDVQRVITDLNRSSVTPLTREEQATAGASRMSEEAADFISRRIEKHGDDATLAQAMNTSGGEIVNRLIEDGVLKPGDRNVLLKDGKATPEAKSMVERLLTGRLYENLDQMEKTPASIRSNIERAAPSLIRLEGSEWDVKPDLRRAIDAATEARGSGMTLDELQKQASMVRAPYTDNQIAIAKILTQGPKKSTAAFRAYAGDFEMARSGGGLFGAPKSAESFAQHFEGKSPAVEEPSLIKAAREREAARTQEKQAGIEYRHAGADPYQLIDQLLIKGYELYQKGRPKFEEWAKKMRKEFGKDSEAHLADVYARLTASQSVNETLRKARSLPKTLEASGRQPGTELEYDVLPNPVATQTAADRIARDGIEKTEQWYRTAEPSAERTEAFRQIGDQLLTQSVYEKDQAKAIELLTRGTELANIEAPRGTTLGQTIQAYSINTKFSPSGALLEATKIAERTKKELSKEDRDLIVRKAVEHQEADTNIKALRDQAELFEDVDRQPRSVEERIAQSGKDNKVIHGATRLLKDRDMGRGDFYREMKSRFNTTQKEATNIFHEAYRLLRESRKAQEEANRKAKIRKANPTAEDKQLQEIYDHLQNELKRRREAKMELSKAFNRLERTNRSWWDRVVNLQRAAMVSRFSTAIRNAQTQFARGAGVEAITDAVETTIRGTFRLDNPLGYRDAWQHFGNYLKLKGQRGRAESVLEEFPTEHEQVLGRYASDVDLPNVGPLSRGAETLLGKAEQGYAALNWANTLQEFTLRSAEFNTKLNQELKARGKPSLQEYLRRGQAEDIPIEAVRAAAKSAQEVTFAERPDRGTRLGRAADDLIQIGNSIPASVSPIGFPRYFYSSMKFLWDYNPSGFLTAGFSKNKPRSVAKALVGSAMLLTAYQVRKNDGGEKWYELYIPGTKQLVDMRPFGPFSLYLFIAEAIRRGMNNERGFTKREVADAAGIAVTRGAAGTFESIYDILTNQSESVQAKAWKALKRTGGETVAAFLSPVQQAKDIVAQFDKSEGVRKDVGTAPFTGPIRENIPYASRGLTPAHLPTAKEPIHQEHPLLKLATGYRVLTPKNFIQQELDRLKFSPQEILTSSGVSEIDNRMKQLMGEIVEKQAERLQHNRAYQNATDPRKALILREMLREARAAARERAEGENPELARKLQRMRQSRREQEAGEPTEGSRRRFAAPKPQGAPPPP